MRRLAPIALVSVAWAVTPALASAQGQPGAPSTDAASGTAAATPAPKPKDGRMTLRVSGGIVSGGQRYVIRGRRVRVTGAVYPFVSGQRLVISVRRGRHVTRYRVPIKPAGRGRGWFIARVPLRYADVYMISARHAWTPKQKAFRSGSRRALSIVPGAGYGARGPRVRILQRLLGSLGFPTGGASGYFGAATARAVLAYRKTNGFGRVSHASLVVYDRLFRRQGRFRLRYPGAGRHVEFDWSRQVLVLASGGRARRVYHASSGKPSTPTVFGTFRFYRKEGGTNSHGMVHSSYFFRGYAIHGYRSVPNYPASHGCIRVPIPNARSIYNWIWRGQRIFVYR